MRTLSDTRDLALDKILRNIDYDSREELKLIIAKKNVDYVFSKEFEKEWEREHLRNLHPALKDLHNQYLEMEELLRKEDKE